MATTFRDWLAREYDADPQKLGGLADGMFRLVRVQRSRWRGRATVTDGHVTVGGSEAPPAAVSRPSWNLLPDAVREQFAALEGVVDAALKLYACGGLHDDSDDAPRVLVGNGVYVVDAGNWPRLETILRETAARWAAAADALCTEDEYQAMVDQVREKVGGEDLFARVEGLIPARAALRNKFGLVYFPLPVRMAPEADRRRDAQAENGRRAVVVEAVEAAVRGPRQRLADALTQFADLLAKPDGSPHRPVGKDGRPRPRTVRVTSVARVQEELAALPAQPDAATRQAIDQLTPYLVGPDSGRGDLARVLAANDETAATTAGLCRAAAAALTDDANLCAAFTARMAAGR